ncbi:MAG TPA: exonuclease domain-containing protein [Pseudonocardiaceae bacterium]|jgi:DNA polymerase III epsilon subunit-like protein|nr:exonuclease domain-containing protein [Pseudonocardiaceae bacterium]
MTDWTSLNYVVVDIEGNGQQPPDLVEVAAVPIEHGKIGQPQSWLVRPDHPITPFVRRIHGISNEQVADAPVFADIAGELRAVLSGAAFVAHNAPADLGVLRRKLPEWEPLEVFDTVRLSRRFRPNQASHRLGALVDAFYLADDLPAGLKPHRATYDALVTARLFVMLITKTFGLPLTLEDLRTSPPSGGDHEAAALF